MSKRSIASILVLFLFAVIAMASASQKEIARHVNSLDPEEDAQEIKAANAAFGAAKVAEYMYNEAMKYDNKSRGK